MFLTELFEAKKHNYLVIYPGRFQPFHKGHRAVYEYLAKKYGRDHVFIATSNKVAPPRSPFNFSQKAAMMRLTGVPMDCVIETAEPYRAPELVNRYTPDTKLIFAVSQKDMDEDPRFAKWTKKDGSPSYFQPMPKDPAEMAGKDQHGYIMVVPTFDFTVLGEPMRSATELRAKFAQADEATQKNMIRDLFGAYDDDVYAIMKHHITEEFGVGVVASRRQAKDPRYKTSLTVDVHPDTPRKNAKALRLV